MTMRQSLQRLKLIPVSNFIFRVYLTNLKKQNLQKRNDSTGSILQKFTYANCLMFFPIVFSLDVAKDLTADKKKDRESGIKLAILQSDEYFKVGKFGESYDVLRNFQEEENAEILWRLARALYHKTKHKGINHSEQVSLLDDAHTYIRKALKLDYNNYAVHKWAAIVLDARNTLKGLTAKIKGLPAFKNHLLKAMELNPNDATTLYILGQYCYNIAAMTWYERKIAATLFATPPEATFEEALYYFSKAEEVEPNFYCLNLLMLGKTYLQLNKIEAAYYWLKCADAYPICTEEDKQMRREVQDLLKKYSQLFKIEEESSRDFSKRK